MTRIILISFTVLFGLKSNATIVYLNNSTPTDDSQRTYNTFNEAYLKCTNGDTIYVTGSNTDYGSIEISKPITIIGPGYFLSENPETQVDKKSAIFRDIEFFVGSEGSTIKGISNSYDNNSEMWIYTSNITVESCYIRDFVAIYRNDDVNISGVTIKKSFMSGNNYNIRFYTNNYDGIWQNINISNNILYTGISVPDGSTGIINGNLIDNAFKIGESSSFEIHNNILLATTNEDISMPLLPNASITHNVSVINIFGADNNNKSFATANQLFIGGDGNSTDGQYQLGGSSGAKEAGVGGIDAGPFDGTDPYQLSGLPNLPNIYELSTGGYVTGDNMNVRIKIKQ